METFYSSGGSQNFKIENLKGGVTERRRAVEDSNIGVMDI